MHTINQILKQYGVMIVFALYRKISLTRCWKERCMALLPTGGGKSICFQVPALYKEGSAGDKSAHTLMKDQVENLKRKGIPALSIFSG